MDADPMARGALMLRLTLLSSMLPTGTDLATPTPTATDTACLELPDTQELPPPSWPGPPRVLARGALMPSPATSHTTPMLMLPSCPCLTPPTGTDLPVTPSLDQAPSRL